MVVVAGIDCGSNSTRLLVSEVNNGEIKKLYKTHNVTKTSEGLEDSNKISTDSKKRLFKVLRGYLREIEKYQASQILCIGTAVFRDAENSEEIIEEIKQKFDINLKVLSGEEEGQTTSIGVLSDRDLNDNFLIVDIGGRSTELIYDNKKKIHVESFNLGVVSLNESFLSHNPLTKTEEESAIEFINNNFNVYENFTNRELIGVAGTFTSIASIYLNQQKYNEEEIHFQKIDFDWMESFYNKIKSMTVAQIIASFNSLDPKRGITLTGGALLILSIMKKFKINELKVSKSDILEGLILKNY
ncbi:MAG: hypothetical protein EVA29_03895 [Candidatus Actinomarinales bacterium]|nr:MAG: hypothetical protein EVA29_03895 [Candidatus Actinomarinales bacterium]